jgi:hypothetical protein
MVSQNWTMKGLSDLLNVNLMDRNTMRSGATFRSAKLQAPSFRLDKLQAIGYSRIRKKR